MNWLSLPKKIWLIIAEWAGVNEMEYTYSYHGYYRPNIFAIYRSCKSFAWLANYYYTHVREVKFFHVVETVDILGRSQGLDYVLHADTKVNLEGIVRHVNHKRVGEHAYPQHFDGDYWYTVNGMEARYHSDQCTGVTYYGTQCDCPKKELLQIEAQVKIHDPIIWTLWYKTYLRCKNMTIIWYKLKPIYEQKIIIRSASDVNSIVSRINIHFK